MRYRTSVIAGEEAKLLQFFTDPTTGSYKYLDALPTVEVFDENPKLNKQALPVQAPVVEQLANIDGVLAPGAYYIIVDDLSEGWHWDQWTYVLDGKEYKTRSQFYVSSDAAVTPSDDPVIAKKMNVELLTSKAFVGEVKYLKFKIEPKTTPSLELRLVSRCSEIIPWTDDLHLDGKGNLYWLVDFTSPATRDGAYTIEARANYGREILLNSGMLLKIERQNELDIPSESDALKSIVKVSIKDGIDTQGTIMDPVSSSVPLYRFLVSDEITESDIDETLTGTEV